MSYILFILSVIGLFAGCAACIQSTRISAVLIRVRLLVIILPLLGSGSGIIAVAI